MSPPVKPFCAQGLHPRTVEFGYRNPHYTWRCRPCDVAWRKVYRAAGKAPKHKPAGLFCSAPCGLKIAGHPRCRTCTILVGVGHLEETRIAGVCQTCVRFVASRLERAS